MLHNKLFLIILVATIGKVFSRQVTLYDENDDVELFDFQTHDSILLSNSTKCTIIQYYLSWCGGCQRTAPFWKSLASENLPWKDVIRVAALDCALQDNKKLCESLKIMRYPTFRLFDAIQFGQPAKEIDVDKLDIKTFSNIMIDHVEKQSYRINSWPNLNAYSDENLDNLFINSTAINSMLIFEDEDSYFARKIIMDFSPYKDQLLIRRVIPIKNPKLAVKLLINPQLKNFPQIVFIKKNLTSNDLQLSILNSTSNNLAKVVESLVQKISKNSSFEAVSNNDLIIQIKQSVNESDLSAEYHLYLQDIESGLNYMLRREIARLPIIKNETMVALKNWLYVLAKYLPGRKPVRIYLRGLYFDVKKIRNQIDQEDWKRMTSREARDSHLPDSIQWVHCKGSLSIYRGYPCSLWSIFHALTVSHAKALKQNQSKDLHEVMRAIQNYIKYFFSCDECAKNFEREIADYETYIQTPDDVIEYLWRVHNHVNARLAGDNTEDPFNPKIQFPSIDKCPKCYDLNKNFVSEEVVNYLISFYSSYGIKGREKSNKKIL